MPTIIAFALCAAAPFGADEPPKPKAEPAAAADFRVAFLHFGEGKEPDSIGEVIASRGRVYHLVKDSKEVIVIDPSRKVVQFLDWKLGVAAELPFREVEARVAANREAERKAVAELARSRSRADRVDAELRGELADPRFRVGYDEATHTLRLSNPAVEVESRGEPDPDAARRALLAEALVMLAKLRAYRDPDNARYFIEIDAVSALAVGKGLRPVESTYLFRLAGPPEKYRWDFRPVEDVTAKERQALDAIEGRLRSARHVPFGRYDRRIDPDDLRR